MTQFSGLTAELKTTTAAGGQEHLAHGDLRRQTQGIGRHRTMSSNSITAMGCKALDNRRYVRGPGTEPALNWRHVHPTGYSQKRTLLCQA
jgi:hypothetical protein